MEKITGTESAYPITWEEEYGDRGYKIPKVYTGLTKLEVFASAQMAAMRVYYGERCYNTNQVEMADLAVGDALALIRALNKCK